jgi:hypothetical protein
MRDREEILHEMFDHKINCEYAFHADCDEWERLQKELNETNFQNHSQALQKSEINSPDEKDSTQPTQMET